LMESNRLMRNSIKRRKVNLPLIYENIKMLMLH